VSTPARRPDPSVTVTPDDLAALEDARRYLVAFRRRVAKDSRCGRNAPQQASDIHAGVTRTLTGIEEGLRVWRKPPPDGQPLPDLPFVGATGTAGNPGKSATALECPRTPQDATAGQTGNGPTERPRRRQASGLHGGEADARRAIPKP
jgi:hypothetical protein